MLPPPVPIVPFLLAAGAMHYPKKKFLASLAFGRSVRFTVIAFPASHYGPQIFRFLTKYYKPALYALIGLAVAGGMLSLLMYLRYRRKKLEPERPIASSSRRKVA